MVDIVSDQTVKYELLFDPNHGLKERVIREQFFWLIETFFRMFIKILLMLNPSYIQRYVSVFL